jgi:hypothetical protein
VCCLQLLLVLASAVIFGTESRGTREHILKSQIRDILFRRLLRRAGLRWRYSTQLPHERHLADQDSSLCSLWADPSTAVTGGCLAIAWIFSPVFSCRYEETHVPFRDRCVATVLLVKIQQPESAFFYKSDAFPFQNTKLLTELP